MADETMADEDKKKKGMILWGLVYLVGLVAVNLKGFHILWTLGIIVGYVIFIVSVYYPDLLDQ